MRVMKNLNLSLTALAILTIIAAACSSSRTLQSQDTEIGIFASSNRENFQKQVVARIGTMPKKWNQIELRKFEKDHVTIYVIYNKMPDGIGEVERDTKRVARAVLDVLVANNYSPTKQWLALFVHAQKPESGETGKALVRSFGKTSYDFNSDSLTFEEASR